MTQIVYADILIIVNTYINYALLRITALICRKKEKPHRLALAAFIAGFYSFIILVEIPTAVLFLLNVLFAVLIIILAFGKKSKREFIRLFVGFFLSNFAFAGIMFALWTFFAPGAMYYKNGVVYFNINTIVLIIMTIICYVVIKLISQFISFKVPQNTIYEVEFECFGYYFKESAFLDTGNSLKEPFSSLPVIIAYEQINCISEKETLASAVKKHTEKIRYIPCSSVGSHTVLKAFRPDYLRINGIETDFKTSDVYIALTDRKIYNGDYAVLLNPEIFSEHTTETEKDYV